VTPPVTARALCDVPSAPDTPTDADIVARIPKANPDLALDTHVRLELGVNPDDAGSSRQAAVVPFLSFSVWAAVLASIMIGAAAAVALGAAIGLFSGQGVWRTAGRQLVAAVIAASVTYGVGHLIGAGARPS
jgi:hypothetical protein